MFTSTYAVVVLVEDPVRLKTGVKEDWRRRMEPPLRPLMERSVVDRESEMRSATSRVELGVAAPDGNSARKRHTVGSLAERAPV